MPDNSFMMNTFRRICCVAFFVLFTACSAQHLNLSLDSTAPVQIDHTQAYCNKFNLNGFNGIITSYFDPVQNKLNTNKAKLFLWEAPYEFKYPKSNYIQFHSFYVKNNREEYNSSPVSIELFNDQTLRVKDVVTAIGHELLEDLDLPIDAFLQTYSFILQDIEGWQGLSMSVFNSKNKPLATTKVLIPPFSAHPDLFLTQNNQEQLLFKLHPFSKISNVNNNEMAFYEKAIDICNDAPVDLPFINDVLTKTGASGGGGGSGDPLQELMQDLSFLDDLS